MPRVCTFLSAVLLSAPCAAAIAGSPPRQPAASPGITLAAGPLQRGQVPGPVDSVPGTVQQPKACKLEFTGDGFSAFSVVPHGETACRLVGGRRDIYKCVNGKWVGTGAHC